MNEAYIELRVPNEMFDDVKVMSSFWDMLYDALLYEVIKRELIPCYPAQVCYLPTEPFDEATSSQRIRFAVPAYKA